MGAAAAAAACVSAILHTDTNSALYISSLSRMVFMWLLPRVFCIRFRVVFIIRFSLARFSCSHQKRNNILIAFDGKNWIENSETTKNVQHWRDHSTCPVAAGCQRISTLWTKTQSESAESPNCGRVHPVRIDGRHHFVFLLCFYLGSDHKNAGGTETDNQLW